ncbi:MAG: hypothetical protein HY270_22305 [Deltaproteobacteria bacterium]|nr:hypothetical protein [Deltaproteobacteria bacterium]
MNSPSMEESATRSHLRRGLEAHLAELGYSGVRARTSATPAPEVVRVNPVRGRIVYGETVLRSDLRSRRCRERLVSFSQRRTRHRSSILFFIAVSEEDRPALEALLEELDIRSAVRGGHVHVVSVVAPEAKRAGRSAGASSSTNRNRGRARPSPKN